MSLDLQIDLLRSFTALAESLNFTRAAAHVGRTQSALSLQIRRLEGITATRLFDRTRRSVSLTAEGEALLVYARRILRLNDEALAHLRQPAATGLVRIGAPDDYATALLPSILAAFARLHPHIRIDVACGDRDDLMAGLARGELDLVLATRHLKDLGGEQVRREPVHWVAAPGFVLPEDQPVPLILYPSGCVCRDLALAALDRDERPWRIAYATRSLALIEQALRAGLGISVMERVTIPEGLAILDGRPGFPPLADVSICLHRRPDAREPATLLMAEMLATRLRSGGSTVVG